MASSNMRKVFDFGTNSSVGHWFPQHMSRAMTKILNSMKAIDCVIEVHDARLPMTGRNNTMKGIMQHKHRVLVLNKIDMATGILDYKTSIQKYNHHNFGIEHTFFTNCGLKHERVSKTITNIIPTCIDLIGSSPRYDRQGDMDYNILVIGVPNVGKSSLLNALRKKNLGKANCAVVGKNPGVTKHVMFKVKVSEYPRVFLVDTPGVLNPKITTMEEGMKLAVCNNVNQHVVGHAMAADFLLYMLNKMMHTDYVERYNLKEPTDDIRFVLNHIAISNQLFERRKILTGVGARYAKVPLFEKAALKMLNDFRDGKLGKFIIDNVVDFPTNEDFNLKNTPVCEDYLRLR